MSSQTTTRNNYSYSPDMIEEMEWPESTPMKDFFRDKTIFLTGATGGIGQLIVQKLLR